MTWLLILAWAAVLAATALMLLSGARPAAETPAGPPADPHATEVAEFRRQLHDWDRDG